MVYWTGAGLLTGWVVSRWLRGSRYGALMLVLGGVVLLLIAAAQHFQAETLLACVAFWIAAQIAWFAGSLATDTLRRRDETEETERSLG